MTAGTGLLVSHALPIVIALRIENRLQFIGGLFHFVFPAQLNGFALCGGDLMAVESGIKRESRSGLHRHGFADGPLKFLSAERAGQGTSLSELEPFRARSRHRCRSMPLPAVSRSGLSVSTRYFLPLRRSSNLRVVGSTQERSDASNPSRRAI